MSLETQKKDLRNARTSRQVAFDFTDEDIKAFYPVFLAKHPDWETYEDPVIRYKSDIRTTQEWENFPYPYKMKQKPGAYRKLEWFRSSIRIPIVKEPPDPYQKWYPMMPDYVKDLSLQEIEHGQTTFIDRIESGGVKERHQKTVDIPEYGKYTILFHDYLKPLTVSANMEDENKSEESGSFIDSPVYLESGDDSFSNSEMDNYSLGAKNDHFRITQVDFRKEKKITWEHLEHLILMGHLDDPRLLIDYLKDKVKHLKRAQDKGLKKRRIRLAEVSWHVWHKADRPIQPWECNDECKPPLEKNWYYANIKYYDLARKTNDYPEKKYVQSKGKDPTFVPFPYVDFAVAERYGTHTYPYTAGKYGLKNMKRYLDKEAAFKKTGGKEYWGYKLHLWQYYR